MTFMLFICELESQIEDTAVAGPCSQKHKAFFAKLKYVHLCFTHSF